MTTIFKELTQKLWQLKKEKKPLTLYELGLQVDIENVEFLALMIYSMFNEWDMYEDVGFETENQPVDLLHAIDILKPFYEDQAMILMMKGKDALNHYRLWEKKHKDLVLDCPHFEKKFTDDEVLLCIKDYDDSQSDFQLLSEGNVIISLLSIKTFLMYVKSIEFETKEIEYAIYSYLEMMNKFNVNLRSILLGCILYGIKEKSEKVYHKLIKNYDQPFVLSLVYEHPLFIDKNKPMSYLKFKISGDFMDDVVEIVSSIDEQVYMSKTFEFAKVYFI
ncbi:MAG: hypothetical protein WC189_04185 [Bacilli bacterium]